MEPLLVLFFLATPSLMNGLIAPTITNGTGEYYIASQSGSFSNDDIICSSSICIIVCDESLNCESTQINASLSSTLKLQCSQYRSCYTANIQNGPTDSVYIDCLNDASCFQATYNVKNTQNVHINCDNVDCISCKTGSGSCAYANIDAQHSNNVDIDCKNVYDCYQSIFNVNNTDITRIKSYAYSLYNADIIGSEISTELTINCSGNSGCRKSDIYCPKNAACNIYCSTDNNVCRDLDVYIDTKDTILFNIYCGTLSSPCNGLDIKCQDTGLTTNYIFYYPDSYICQDMKCCPTEYQYATKVIECSIGTECIINGTQCQYKTIINATHASALTINCNANECQHIDIKCPFNGDCTLNCLDTQSCEGANILQGTTNSLNLNCMDLRSCHSMNIDLIITGKVDIKCHGEWSCGYIDFNLIVYGDLINFECIQNRYNCRFINFNIEATENTDIFVNATALTTLYRTELNVNQAKTLNINCMAAADDSRPCFDFDTTANHINSINILCEGWQSCYQNKWDLKADDVMFLCNGDLSCGKSTFTSNVSNSISMTTSNETAFTESGINVFCWDCMNIYNCLSNMTIYCGSNVSPFPINENDQCRNCLCDASINNTVQYIPYDGIQYMWEQCIPTPKPTSIPTATPTNNPSLNPSRTPTTSPTRSPSHNPTLRPTKSPTKIPTLYPTLYPSEHPTTSNPTTEPTFNPTSDPTPIPTIHPTNDPTMIPTPNEDEVDDETTMTPTISSIVGVGDKLNTKRDDTLPIIGSVIGIVMFLVLIIIIYIVHRRKKRQNLSMIKNTNTMLKSEEINNIQMISYPQTPTYDLGSENESNIHVTKGNDDTLEIAGVLDVENDLIITGDDEVTSGNLVVDDDTSPEGSENIGSDDMIMGSITLGNMDDNA